ncbi:MAG: heat shock protein HtpX, partial [Patescibacteria group bacterium]|nr:heat shock protein HtpX [Patescibacteria group bacterium]
MATLYTHQAQNIRKTWLLMTTFFVLIVAIGYAFSYYYQNPNILYIFLAFSIGMNVYAYWNSDKVAIKLSGAIPAEPTQYKELHNIVENLSITAGLPKPRVFIINDTAPNAFATGRDKDHSAVAVTTGLLQILDRNELEGVIAHELSHIGNRDILISTVAVVLAGFITIVADMFIRSQLFGGNRDSDNKAGGVLVIVGIVLAILAPIFASLIQLAISRKREFLADASGALLTRYPEGLASALQKISQ